MFLLVIFFAVRKKIRDAAAEGKWGAPLPLFFSPSSFDLLNSSSHSLALRTAKSRLIAAEDGRDRARSPREGERKEARWRGGERGERTREVEVGSRGCSRETLPTLASPKEGDRCESLVETRGEAKLWTGGVPRRRVRGGGGGGAGRQQRKKRRGRERRKEVQEK